MAGSQKDRMLQKPFSKLIIRHPLFFLRLASPTDPNFWHFQKRRRRKKKSNDVVKLFFTWNNSFNLKNEHITA